MAMVATEEGYMSLKLGTTVPVWEQKKGKRDDTSSDQGPVPNQTAFFLSATFLLCLPPLTHSLPAYLSCLSAWLPHPNSDPCSTYPHSLQGVEETYRGQLSCSRGKHQGCT
jgi:hypothetical protein